jgi:hypothetical protein
VILVILKTARYVQNVRVAVRLANHNPFAICVSKNFNKMVLIASHVEKIISGLILNVYLAQTYAQLVLHHMNALNVKGGLLEIHVIKNAPQDAKTMFVTRSRVTVHARKHMLDIIAIIVFPESLDMIANLTARQNACYVT